MKPSFFFFFHKAQNRKTVHSLGSHTIVLLSCRKIKKSQGYRWMPCHCLLMLRHLALSKHLLRSLSASGHASELFIVKPGCCGNCVTAGKSQLCLWLHFRFETNWLHTCSNLFLLYDNAIECYLFSLCVYMCVGTCVCGGVDVCACVCLPAKACGGLVICFALYFIPFYWCSLAFWPSYLAHEPTDHTGATEVHSPCPVFNMGAGDPNPCSPVCMPCSPPYYPGPVECFLIQQEKKNKRG